MAQAGIAKYSLRTPLVDVLDLVGSFTPAGSGAVTNVLGLGFTVARTGTGVYRVTITRPWNALIAVDGKVIYNDSLYHEARVNGITVPTSAGVNGYFDITHLSSADVSTTNLAAADITASGQLRRICFRATLALLDCPGNGV